MSRMYFNSRHLSPVTLHELMNGTVDNVASIPDVSKEGSITGVYVKVPDENINGTIPEDLAAIFEIANKLKINFAIIKNEGGMSFADLRNYGEEYDDTCFKIMNPVSDFIVTARELSERLIEGAKKNKGATSNDRFQLDEALFIEAIYTINGNDEYLTVYIIDKQMETAEPRIEYVGVSAEKLEKLLLSLKEEYDLEI